MSMVFKLLTNKPRDEDVFKSRQPQVTMNLRCRDGNGTRRQTEDEFGSKVFTANVVWFGV